MTNDIEEDWALVRGVTIGVTVTGVLDSGVEDDWNDIKGLPEWIYTVHSGYSAGTMALWRLKPKGHRTGNYPGLSRGRMEEFWTFWHDTLLWCGASYTPHSSTA